MAIQFKDYYETLGVARTATADEIKSAFRKLARIHHPDVAKNKAVGEAKFKEINEAYEVLGDPEKRRQYDELGTNHRNGAEFTPPGGARRRYAAPNGGASFEFTGTGFSDFFETFFGAQRGDPFQRGSFYEDEPARPARGHDAEADLLVRLEELLRGTTREVTVRRPASDGGAGRTDTYQVKIPAGVREGKRIRLAGQGGPGRAGGPAGDLFLRVRLAAHPDFRVEGDDLHVELDLAPWEAVLGVKVNVPTLDGAAAVQIKPGSQAGSLVRLRGLGLPGENGGRGDLFATLQVKVPTTLTAQERTLWEQLAKESSFNARDEG